MFSTCNYWFQASSPPVLNTHCMVSSHCHGQLSDVMPDRCPIMIWIPLWSGARNPMVLIKLFSKSLFIGTFQLRTLLTLCRSMEIPVINNISKDLEFLSKKFTGGEGAWKPMKTSWVHCRLWLKIPATYPPITDWVHSKSCDWPGTDGNIYTVFGM